MRRISRLFIASAAVAASLAIPSLASQASASTTPHVRPTINAARATFVVPSGSSSAWMVRLWTLPTPSTLEGSTIGSSGTLAVKVPATAACDFQVDVLQAPAGTTNPKDFTWYSGLTAIVPGCGSNHCPASAITIRVIGPHGSSNVPPTINRDDASFTIPSGTNQAWVLRLWSLPTPSTLEGQVFGSSGTLTLNVPDTSTCEFQVDVKVAPAGTTNPNDFTWYSGVTATV